MAELDLILRNTPISVTELNRDLKKPLDKPWVMINDRVFALDVRELKAALKRHIHLEVTQAKYDANRAVLEEQKKFLMNMIIPQDSKTMITALPVGMMYACANRLAVPLEFELKAARDEYVMGLRDTTPVTTAASPDPDNTLQGRQNASNPPQERPHKQVSNKETI